MTTEILTVVVDSDERVVAICGSATLLKGCEKTYPGIHQIVREPEFFDYSVFNNDQE